MWPIHLLSTLQVFAGICLASTLPSTLLLHSRDKSSGFDGSVALPDGATTRFNDKQANVVAEIVNPVFEFCRLEFSRSVILDDKLWIDGGSTQFANGHTGMFQISEINGHMLWIDLTKPFNRANYTINHLLKPTRAPSVEQGEIWLWPKEPTKFYVYGGFFPGFNKSAVGYKKPARDPPGDIYSYDIKSNTWELVQPSPDSSPVIWSMEGGSTYAPELGQFFYMGGYEDAWVNSALEGDGKNSSANYKLMRPYHTVPGFLRLDMEADAGPKWTNETIKYADGSIEDLQRVRGQLIYVPLGKQGIIVKLGGEDYKTGLGNEVTRASNLRTMNEIHIYDIATSTWYIQLASGPTRFGVPKPRQQLCLTLAPAADNSSYNIFMYGGGQNNRFGGYDEVWILSLPSFVWVKAYEGSNGTVGASCHLYKQRQMLITGGRRSDNRDCHVFWKIYDITDGAWKDEFNPALEGFQVPDVLMAEIGGGKDGGSSAKTPASNGWSSKDLETIFSTFPGDTTDEDQVSIGNDSNQNTTNDDANSGLEGEKGPGVGAIIGGVIGALAVLAVLGAVFFLFQRRRRRRRRIASSPPPAEIFHQPCWELDNSNANIAEMQDHNSPYATRDSGLYELSQTTDPRLAGFYDAPPK